MKAVFLLIFAAVLIAGCASQTAATYPTFKIKSPGQGQVIQDSTVELVLDDVQDVVLVTPNGSVVDGQGHFHLFLDNANEIMTPRLVYTFDVTSGEHAIRIELRRGDHSAFSPAIIKSVSFTVAGQLPSPSTLPIPATLKEFNITAQQFSFTPSTITVNKGDTILINAKSMDVTHGFSIADYNINLQLTPGTTQTATFTADTAGNFSFICSVFCGSGHADMKGTLVVNP